MGGVGGSRGVAWQSARLESSGTAAGALEPAERRGARVFSNGAGVAGTRRPLFGFEMPSLPRLFGPEGAVELESIDSTLANASSVGEGRWVFRLADGSEWRQIDSERVRFRNSPGQPVRVRKGALNSFLLTIDGSRAVRVRRQ